jgi:hypothetical protein
MMRGVLVPGTVGPLALPGGPDAVFAGGAEEVLAGAAEEEFAGGTEALFATQPVDELGDAVSSVLPVLGSTRRGVGITEPGGVAVKTLPGCVVVLPTGPCGPGAVAPAPDCGTLPAAPAAGPVVFGAAVGPVGEAVAPAGATEPAPLPAADGAPAVVPDAAPPALAPPADCAYSGVAESSSAAKSMGDRRCFMAVSLRIFRLKGRTPASSNRFLTSWPFKFESDRP